MTIQNYLLVNTTNNIVENNILWDGNTQTWQPPENSLMLIDAKTYGKVWILNKDQTDWILEPILGAGDIGFTWNGTECVTNEPKPEPPSPTQEL